MAIALSALVWTLSDDDRAMRLLALTGLTRKVLKRGRLLPDEPEQSVARGRKRKVV